MTVSFLDMPLERLCGIVASRADARCGVGRNWVTMGLERVAAVVVGGGLDDELLMIFLGLRRVELMVRAVGAARALFGRMLLVGLAARTLPVGATVNRFNAASNMAFSSSSCRVSSRSCASRVVSRSSLVRFRFTRIGVTCAASPCDLTAASASRSC